MELPLSKADVEIIDDNEKIYVSPARKRLQFLNYIKIAVSIFLWYFFSIVATVLNKVLLTKDDAVNPLTLTFFHVTIASICDWINMKFFHKKELRYYTRHFNLKITGKYIMPLSFAMMLAKFLTYKSYGLIPVSLTHTVKALQPLFNVFIVYLWTGDTVDSLTFLSLIPIAFGVTYASVTEIDFQWIGFYCALSSTIISVWQGIYLKMLMAVGLQKNYIHLCNATISSIILFPVIICIEFYSNSYRHIELSKVILSAIIQYLSSISSYSAMYLMSSLSHSITSTFKRICIILFTSVFFHKQLLKGNVLGILVASVGALLYNIASKKITKKRKLPTLGLQKELSFCEYSMVKE